MIQDLFCRVVSSDAPIWLWLTGLLVLVYWLRKWQVDRQIARYGARAPQVPIRLPFAFDFIYKASKAGHEHRDVEFWTSLIRDAKGASKLKYPKTAEISTSMGNRAIVTIDPENIKAILTGQFADYGKGEPFHRDWKEFLGDSIFTTDGELWSRSRQLIRPMFVRERIVDTEIFEKHVQKLILLLGGTPTGSNVVDVGPLFFRYTLDAATDYLLGQGTDSLDNPETKFAEAFRYVQGRQSEIFRYGVFNFLLSRKRFRAELKTMDDFIQPYIQKVLSLSAEELDHKLSKRETFLDALARFTRDPRVLRDQLVAVLLAGRDTTAATLCFCIFELSRNPEIVSRLRAEIDARLGLGLSSGRKPTYTDLKEMKLLHAVLNETMRLYPVVPFNVRYSLHNTSLPRGGGPDGTSPIGVLGDTRIIYSTMLMQRSPEHYDPPTSSSQKYFDPGKWHPDRWMTGTWQPKPWHFIPFNGGPRICIGQQFATVEMGYTVVRVLQAFERVVAVPVRGREKVEDPVLRFEVTLSPAEELNCVFLREGEEMSLRK